MPRRRRRAQTSRTYSLGDLLSRQPKTLRKHAGYPVVLAHYHSSRRLQTLRVNRRCFTLLDNARINPENLSDFYRTYRLPTDAFFPLFLAIKRDYLVGRERIRSERHLAILEKLRSLPESVLATFKYLGYLERYYHSAGRSPVWQKDLFPGSKKKADWYLRRTTSDWIAIFGTHLDLLSRKYPAITGAVATRVLACFVLGLPQVATPPTRPDPVSVAKNYRRQSLLYHPDRGGDPGMFIRVKRARDALVGAP